ncbi:MAG: N-methyl-L-tryptophan oxidase [Planctomycetaceae bacterium]|nr:N-methyl-L-tryptophan oxidase [Planctomycetaceae bacterium]
MAESYDCIVLGVGGFGSSTVYHLAKRDLRVLGIDQFPLAHDRGSSHGDTRIIRKAYFEHPAYVPLLQRAYQLWDEVQSEYADLTANSAEHLLLNRCGVFSAGPHNGIVVNGIRQAAKQHALAYEDISASDAKDRFPGYQIPEGFDIVFESEAGYLHVERCVSAFGQLAQQHGATLKTNEQVIGWSSTSNAVEVKTDNDTYHADSLIITAGAWSDQILDRLNLPLTVLRKVLLWHQTADRSFDVDAGRGGFFFDMPYGRFYGFPCLDGRTVKLAEHSGGETVHDPLNLDRSLKPSDTANVRKFLSEVMPNLDIEPSRHVVCMYTMTPDENFIIDRHPEFANVCYGAGFSGHGFKFTSSIGEALADIATTGSSALPIEFLSPRRFLQA